jgi:hypothetical protein
MAEQKNTAAADAPPLAKKLGIKPGHRVAILHAPTELYATLGQLPEDVELFDAPTGVERGLDAFDVVLWFGTDRAALAQIVDNARRTLKPDGALWIGWPKRASGIPTEVTDNIVREVALPTGLVDNKICAIDAAWSGIRLVLRRELRPR